MEKSKATILVTLLLGLGWGASVVFGTRVLLAHENKSHREIGPPSTFPVKSALAPAADRPTLIMRADSHGPSTGASLGQLAQVMAELQGQVKAYVVFSRPANGSQDWNATGLWQTAAAIPEVIPVGDDDGHETRHFGIETSGHTLLYAADGSLVFSGEIPPSALIKPAIADARSAHSK